MLWSPSTIRMFLTRVPCLRSFGAPLTFKSLIKVTVSPSANLLPFASIATTASSTSVCSAGFHSYAHSGQIRSAPSSYTYSELHFCQFGS